LTKSTLNKKQNDDDNIDVTKKIKCDFFPPPPAITKKPAFFFLVLISPRTKFLFFYDNDTLFLEKEREREREREREKKQTPPSFLPFPSFFLSFRATKSVSFPPYQTFPCKIKIESRAAWSPLRETPVS